MSSLADDTAQTQCQWCEAPCADDTRAEWSFERSRGRTTFACPGCVRNHLAEIESLT